MASPADEIKRLLSVYKSGGTLTESQRSELKDAVQFQILDNVASRHGTGVPESPRVPRLAKPSGNQGAFNGPIKDGFGVALPPLRGPAPARRTPVPPTVNPAAPVSQAASAAANDMLSATPDTMGKTPLPAGPKPVDPLAQALSAGAQGIFGPSMTPRTAQGKDGSPYTVYDPTAAPAFNNATDVMPLSQITANAAAVKVENIGSAKDPLAQKTTTPDGTTMINSNYGSVVGTAQKPGDPVRTALVNDPYQKDKMVSPATATASYMANDGGKIAAALTAADNGATAGANYMQWVQDSNPINQHNRAIIQMHIGDGLMADGRAFPEGTTDDQKVEHWNQFAPVNGSLLPAGLPTDPSAVALRNKIGKAAEARMAQRGDTLPSQDKIKAALTGGDTEGT